MSALGTQALAVLDRLTSLFYVGTLAATPEQRDTERLALKNPQTNLVNAGNGLYMGSFYNWRHLPEIRINEMRFYDYLSIETPDTDNALNAYATMATTGSTTGASRKSFVFRVKRDAPEDVRNRIARLNNIVKRHAFTVIRGMAKYGSYTPQIKLGLDPSTNTYGVVDLEHIPPGTMHRNILPDGSGDDEEYWFQQIEGQTISKKIPRWRVPHFALWTEVVSADYSLIYGTSVLKRCGRAALHVSACLDAMVVARLTRATMKYQHKIACQDIAGDNDRIQERLQQYMQFNAKQKTSALGGNGVSGYVRAPIPDEDFFTASFAGVDSGVEKIEGDANLSEIGDVDMLLKIFHGSLGVPPEYLGQDRSQGGRSQLSQIDVQFARTARHLQWFGAAAFEQLLWVDLILAGYDPEELEAECLPPAMGARDDLLKAQIMNLYSQVLSNLKTAGMDLTLDPAWVMTVFFDMSDELDLLDKEKIGKLFKDLEKDAAKLDANSQRQDPRSGNLSKDELTILQSHTEAIMSNIKDLLGPTGVAMDRASDEEPFIPNRMSPYDLRAQLQSSGLLR